MWRRLSACRVGTLADACPETSAEAHNGACNPSVPKSLDAAG